MKKMYEMVYVEKRRNPLDRMPPIAQTFPIQATDDKEALEQLKEASEMLKKAKPRIKVIGLREVTHRNVPLK